MGPDHLRHRALPHPRFFACGLRMTSARPSVTTHMSPFGSSSTPRQMLRRLDRPKHIRPTAAPRQRAGAFHFPAGPRRVGGTPTGSGARSARSSPNAGPPTRPDHVSMTATHDDGAGPSTAWRSQGRAGVSPTMGGVTQDPLGPHNLPTQHHHTGHDYHRHHGVLEDPLAHPADQERPKGEPQ